jgi:hypothetical protein
MDTAERSLGIAVLPLGGDLQVVGIGMSGVSSYMLSIPIQIYPLMPPLPLLADCRSDC